MQIACLEINRVYIIIQQKKKNGLLQEKFFFWSLLNILKYFYVFSAIMFIVLGYNNTFQLRTKDIFPKTHNNMKHSHCSSLLVFVHDSNLAGCNSEDILEKAYQKSW